MNITPYIDAIVEKMMKCRTPELGYSKFQCPKHPEKERVVPHSCKTKICTTCAKIQNDMWGEEMKQRFPVGNYFHITFTMPEEFREFFGTEEDPDWKRKGDLYSLGNKTIQGYFLQKGIQTGGITVLHTFGRAINLNPHLHTIIPAGGLKKTKKGWSWEKVSYIEKNYLSKAWKYNLLEYVLKNTSSLSYNSLQLMKWIKSENIDDCKKLQKYIEENIPYEEQEKWMKVFGVDYYVNISHKKKYSQTICYVARYTRRLPISKSKIIHWDEKEEIVKWRYVPHGKTKEKRAPVDTTMHVYRFFDKILQHISPKNFRTVRYFGIFAQQKISFFRDILEKLCSFDTPEKILSWSERQILYTDKDPLICPCCKKDMIMVEKAYILSSGEMKVVPVEKK